MFAVDPDGQSFITVQAAVVTSEPRQTRLLTVHPVGLSRPGGLLDEHAPWLAAFEQAGQALCALPTRGGCVEGYAPCWPIHLIFHANRAGICVPDLSTKAALTMAGTFGFDAMVSGGPRLPLTTKVPAMTTIGDHHTPVPEALCAAMTQRLADEQVIRTPAVREAFAAVAATSSRANPS